MGKMLPFVSPYTISKYLITRATQELLLFLFTIPMIGKRRENGTQCALGSLHNEKVETFHICTLHLVLWCTYAAVKDHLEPSQVFTSVHLLKKFVGSRFTINSPRFQNNWVKIHRRKNGIGQDSL